MSVTLTRQGGSFGVYASPALGGRRKIEIYEFDENIWQCPMNCQMGKNNILGR